MALGVWFLFVLVFDLGLLALLVSVQGGGDWLPWLLLLNPTDGFRLINMVGFDSAQAFTGVTAIASESAFQRGWLALVLVGWTLVPLGLAILRFRHHSA